MVKFLQFLGYLAIMLAVVPLAGLCVTGSWKQAWRYTLAWGRAVGILVLAALVVFLIVWGMVSPE